MIFNKNTETERAALSSERALFEWNEIFTHVHFQIYMLHFEFSGATDLDNRIQVQMNLDRMNSLLWLELFKIISI